MKISEIALGSVTLGCGILAGYFGMAALAPAQNPEVHKYICKENPHRFVIFKDFLPNSYMPDIIQFGEVLPDYLHTGRASADQTLSASYRVQRDYVGYVISEEQKNELGMEFCNAPRNYPQPPQKPQPIVKEESVLAFLSK